MIGKALLILTALAIAAVLIGMTPEPAAAARGRGGSRGHSQIRGRSGARGHSQIRGRSGAYGRSYRYSHNQRRSSYYGGSRLSFGWYSYYPQNYGAYTYYQPYVTYYYAPSRLHICGGSCRCY